MRQRRLRPRCPLTILNRCRLRWWLHYKPFPMTILELAVVFNQFSWIVTELCRNPVPRIAHRFDGWIVFHDDSVSPSNSRGVTNNGTNSPKIPLIRRMWANLLAFARCLQFHVSKKSHRCSEASAKCKASPAGSAGMTWCLMYASTMSALASSISTRGTFSIKAKASFYCGKSPLANSSMTASLVTRSKSDRRSSHHSRVHARRANISGSARTSW
jgi:hypothetical protein